MKALIDLTHIHRPPENDPRVHGRKLKEMGKYVGLSAALAGAAGFYFYYLQGRGYIYHGEIPIALGISLTLVIAQLIRLLDLQTVLAVALWLVTFISGEAIGRGGLRDSEVGLVLFSISGTLLLITLTLIIKGNILLKTYQ